MCCNNNTGLLTGIVAFLVTILVIIIIYGAYNYGVTSSPQKYKLLYESCIGKTKTIPSYSDI